jgi:hypothetical protein
LVRKWTSVCRRVGEEWRVESGEWREGMSGFEVGLDWGGLETWREGLVEGRRKGKRKREWEWEWEWELKARGERSNV